MSSWLVIILLIFILLAVGILYLYKQNKLPSWLSLPDFLSGFLSPHPEELVEKLKARTELEKEKAKELQEILQAKQELMQAKAQNSKLRRSIAEVNETNVSLVAKRFSFSKHQEEE